MPPSGNSQKSKMCFLSAETLRRELPSSQATNSRFCPDELFEVPLGSVVDGGAESCCMSHEGVQEWTPARRSSGVCGRYDQCHLNQCIGRWADTGNRLSPKCADYMYSVEAGDHIWHLRGRRTDRMMEQFGMFSESIICEYHSRGVQFDELPHQICMLQSIQLFTAW